MEKVDYLIDKEGLTTSALTEVNKIYAIAKKENQQPQIIKSLIYKASLQQQTEEEGEMNSIKAFEKK